MSLASRYEELWFELQKRGVAKPGYEALLALHAELHPDGKGAHSTTKWLVRIGAQESNFFDELNAKRHNQEPLSDFEQLVLHKLRLRWLRWLRRHGR